MPNYEPTPRRFSTLSVPQTPSRRNSFDNVARPSLAASDDVGVFPPLSSPLDLSAVLKRLQQSHGDMNMPETDGDMIIERGRTRQSAGHRRSATAWSHGDSRSPMIQIPSARKRETSASTRERIALWEERSRSQSKGRSKSRTRDLGHASSRISVVPEMPELPSVFGGLKDEEDVGGMKIEEDNGSLEQPTEVMEDTLLRLEGQDRVTSKREEADVDEGPTGERTDNGGLYGPLNEKEDHGGGSENSESGAIKFCDSLDEELSSSQKFKANIHAWPGSMAHSPPQSPQLGPTSPRYRQVLDDTRPKTPVGTVPALLPTPDATPRQVLSRYEEIETKNTGMRLSESPKWDAVEVWIDAEVKTIAKASGDTLQLESKDGIVLKGGVDLEEQEESETGLHNKASLATGSAPDFQAVIVEPLADVPLLVENVHMHSSSNQPPKSRTTGINANQGFKLDENEDPPKLPPRHAASTNETGHPRTRYHEVWKITDYAPDFPLPAKPTVQATLDHATLARAPFEGNPLQELPRSHLPRTAEAYRPPPESVSQNGPDPYPYWTSTPREEDDWAVDIPPSPTSAYHRTPDDYRPARQTRRRSRSGSRRQRIGGGGAGRLTSRGGDLESGRARHEWDTPPVIERAFHAASVSIFQSLAVPMGLYRGFRDVYYPPPERPDIIKAYPVRRRLPVRIFFPSHHDLTSPALLPTLFTIHGGGFTVGYASDDDKWNRTFADTYTIMVISLNYSKAPWACFPAPLHDTEALYHAVLNDESLPIDRMRTALCGFDAGANLALALCQLPSVRTGRDPNPPRFPPPAALNPSFSPISPTPSTSRTNRTQSNNLNRHRSMYFSTGAPLPQGYRPNTYQYPASYPYQLAPPLKSNPPPSAVIPICGILDFTTPPSKKSLTRPYKPSLKGPRGWGHGFDYMARILPSSAWSYIPYGHDTSDPLLSPFFAKREDLPPHVFVLGAELDCLASESWRAACSWAAAAGNGNGSRITVPDEDMIVGRRDVSRWRGCLDDGGDLDGQKFGWVCYHRKDAIGTGNREEEEEEEAEITGSTRWLLVPDVVHGFDSAPWRNKYLWGDEEARMDAVMKTLAYQREMAEWLWGVVWR